MGLLNDKNKNALIDLSDRIDPDSINVNVYDNTIFIPFIKEISSQAKKITFGCATESYPCRNHAPDKSK